jgi:hypothetical protein
MLGKDEISVMILSGTSLFTRLIASDDAIKAPSYKSSR